MKVEEINSQIKNIGEQKSLYMHVKHVEKEGGKHHQSKIC